MAHSVLFKCYYRKYRKVVIGYMASSDGRYHRKTFKNCTLSEALHVFSAMADVWHWYYVGETCFEY